MDGGVRRDRDGFCGKSLGLDAQRTRGGAGDGEAAIACGAAKEAARCIADGGGSDSGARAIFNGQG